MTTKKSSYFNDKFHQCREMQGNGVGRGEDKADDVMGSETIIRKRKFHLQSCEQRWSTEFTSEQRESLLSLREKWTKDKVANEHLIIVKTDEKTEKKLEFLRYRLLRGDFNKDIL